jgi:hypothetical protein
MPMNQFVRSLITHRLRSPAIAALTCLTILSGCGGGGSDSTPAPTSNLATVKGKVFNAQDGTPISGATIKAGTATATSAADGTYEITSVTPGDRVSLVAEAANYADNLKITSAAANTTSNVDIKLLKAGAVTQINSTTGGTVTVPSSTAQVVLPANFAANADGTAATGNVTVKVTPIAPALDSTLMPGDYLTATPTGNASIESFGALAVTLNSSTGATLNLASGKTATIRIPLSTRAASGTSPATIPLFFLSPQTGLWVQEGTAALRGTAPNQYYEGTVTHFSTWNADQIINTISVTGTVRDDLNAAVGGVTLRCDGIDYSGSSTAVSDSNGRFTIKMKRSGLCTLAGYIGNKFTNDVRVGPSAIDLSLSADLVLAAASNNVKIKLTWGANPTDLDSYLTLPTGEVLNYSNDGNLLAAPFANLDVDDVTSFGPEVITIRRLMVGTYRYAVHNFSGTSNPGITASPAKVELTIGSNTSVYAAPAGEPSSGKNAWNVLSLTVSANCTVTVATIATWSPSEPLPTTGPAATYCVAP